MKDMLIGICGKSGAGKSTVGQWLVERYGLFMYAFADPLKDGIAAMLGIPRAWMEDQEMKKRLVHPYNVTLRHMLQTLGTQWGRGHIHTDVWLMRAAQVIQENSRQGTVVTDVRYDNEAEFIRSRGGTIVHVVRDSAGLSGDTAKHSSEAGIAILPNDMVVDNNGTLEVLHMRLDSMFHQARSAA